jgi:hypothetical protein
MDLCYMHNEPAGTACHDDVARRLNMLTAGIWRTRRVWPIACLNAQRALQVWRARGKQDRKPVHVAARRRGSATCCHPPLTGSLIMLHGNTFTVPQRDNGAPWLQPWPKPLARMRWV